MNIISYFRHFWNAGLYFLLNGQNKGMQVAELSEEEGNRSEAFQTDISPKRIDLQTNNTSRKKAGTYETSRPAERIEVAATNETDGKSSHQLRILKYLQLHYTFRYNRLTDRNGSRRFNCVEVEHSIDCTTPIEYDYLCPIETRTAAGLHSVCLQQATGTSREVDTYQVRQRVLGENGEIAPYPLAGTCFYKDSDLKATGYLVYR